jgi:hypothetical protein
MNLPFGNNHITTNGPNDDRIFEIGSAKFVGNNWVQNNAFEVSYNGHSIVTHTNGSSLGGSPKVYQGATYVESPVYAWGAIDAAGNPIGNANFGISQVIPLWPMFTPNQGTYLITLAPADPHGGPIPDITQASVTVTVLNNKTDDFILAPPIPPMAPGMEEKFIAPRTISDSLVQAIFGPPTIERVSSDSPEGLQSPTPIDQNATYCGYATASQVGITILATTYPNSFIVRTYGQISLENPCYQQPRAFFFKVTHR